MKQQILFFVGVDKSGKTSIAKELSLITDISYFKNPLETNAFKKDYIDALHYEASIMYQFLFQTGYSIIRDREFPCEAVYSKVFNRQTDIEFIKNLDEKYAKLNAKIIYCYKDIYKNFVDSYVPFEKIELIKQEYENYLKHTNMRYLKLNTTDENLENQIRIIMSFIGD